VTARAQDDAPATCYARLLSAPIETAVLPSSGYWSTLGPNVATGAWVGSARTSSDTYYGFSAACSPEADLFMERTRDAVTAAGGETIATRQVGDDTVASRFGGLDSFSITWRTGDILVRLDVSAPLLSEAEAMAAALQATLVE
jgi:hypothetical protein